MTVSHGFLIPLIWFISNIGQLEKETVNTYLPTSRSKSQIIYNNLSQKHSELPSFTALEIALQGYEKLENELEKPILSVIDFSLPSTEKRLWIIDVAEEKILLHTVVSHGRNSGLLIAEKFSNTPESNQSSLGFFKTAETYQGKHGYSLRLDGLEKGVNDQARNRAIVIHGADYAREVVAKLSGRLGRSLGCPAVPTELSTEVIDLIKNGSLLFIYAPDNNYLSLVPLLKS